jgi:outer membrane protein assembly factor BamB
MVDLPKPTTQGPNTAHATPVIWKDQIVLHRSGELAGYSTKDGTRLWWTPLGSQGASPPVAQGDVIYVNAYSLSEAGQRVALPTYEEALAKYDKNADGKIQLSEIPGDAPYITRQDTPSTIAFSSIGLRGFANFADFNKNGVLEPEEWKQLKDGPPTDLNGLYAVAPKGTGQLPAESILWKDGRNLPEVPAPIVYGDRVCNINNGGILSCFEAKTGKVIHRGRIGTPGAYFSSPIYAAGQIYVASTDGVVSVIKADNYETLSKADLGEGMFATPAALGSRLYVRTTGHLWAFGDK